MAKPLVFQWQDRTISFDMVKVDRAKLYGFKESEVRNDEGGICQLATLAQDGQTVVGRGGASLGTLTVDGHWIEKGSLRPVDTNGQTIQPVSSSFSAPVPLAEKATAEDYLDCSVRAIYLMETSDDIAPLRDELLKGTIYRFSYSYRGGLEPDLAFLLANTDGLVFCAVGKPAKIEYLGLAEAASTVEEEDVAEEEDAETIDFNMM